MDGVKQDDTGLVTSDIVFDGPFPAEYKLGKLGATRKPGSELGEIVQGHTYHWTGGKEGGLGVYVSRNKRPPFT